MSTAFYRMMNEPISIALYQVEVLEELINEQKPKQSKPGFDDNTFTKVG